MSTVKKVGDIYFYEDTVDPTSSDADFNHISIWKNTSTGGIWTRCLRDTGWTYWGTSAFDLAAAIHAATTKTPPVDADEFGFWDSVSSALRNCTWANFKSTLKTYFDGIYSALGHTHAQLHDRAHSVTSTSDHTFPAIPAGDFLRDDGTWQPAGGGSGHTIQDGDGNDMTARTNLQFLGDAVSDDAGNDRTIAGYTQTERQHRQAKVSSRLFLTGN